MKHKRLAIVIIFVCVGIVCLKVLSLYVSNVPKFTRYVDGYHYTIDWRDEEVIDSSHFFEYVYVYNLPQDRLVQLKLMLSYADSVTSGFQSPREMKNLSAYWIYFYEIRKISSKLFFSWLWKWVWKDRKDCVGYVTFYLICENPPRWCLDVDLDASTPEFDGNYTFPIFDECYGIGGKSSDTVEIRHKLANHYKELRNKSVR